jgi:hypothetical protein
MIGAFLVPLAIIMAINLTLFVVIFGVLLRASAARNRRTSALAKDHHQRWKELRASVAISVVLGLSWLFGAFVDSGLGSSTSLAFQYLFAITTTLQGFIIFLVYVLLNKQVRDEFRRVQASSSASSSHKQKLKAQPARLGAAVSPGQHVDSEAFSGRAEQESAARSAVYAKGTASNGITASTAFSSPSGPDDQSAFSSERLDAPAATSVANPSPKFPRSNTDVAAFGDEYIDSIGEQEATQMEETAVTLGPPGSALPSSAGNTLKSADRLGVSDKSLQATPPSSVRFASTKRAPPVITQASGPTPAQAKRWFADNPAAKESLVRGESHGDGTTDGGSDFEVFRRVHSAGPPATQDMSPRQQQQQEPSTPTRFMPINRARLESGSYHSPRFRPGEQTARSSVDIEEEEEPVDML